MFLTKATTCVSIPIETQPFGNGMPLAAVVTTRAIAQSFAGQKVEYFNTFGGNPVCAAAGLAVLEVSANQIVQVTNPSRRGHWPIHIRISCNPKDSRIT
jgi:acetylornithine/succinyldiaminopimelate/putrescine aminotransferase